MAAFEISIGAVCMLGCFVFNQPIGGDRDKFPDEAINKRQQVVDTLEAYLFVEELTGNNDGYWVVRMLESVGSSQGQPWCGAFQGFIQLQCGLPIPTVAARAAAWFTGPHLVPNLKAREGDLGSLYNGSRIFHIVRFLKPFNTPGPYVVTGEGNTNAQGSAEGNRAAKRYRLKSTIHSSADWITKN
jgi:hypothetical protein